MKIGQLLEKPLEFIVATWAVAGNEITYSRAKRDHRHNVGIARVFRTIADDTRSVAHVRKHHPVSATFEKVGLRDCMFTREELAAMEAAHPANPDPVQAAAFATAAVAYEGRRLRSMRAFRNGVREEYRRAFFPWLKRRG